MTDDPQPTDVLLSDAGAVHRRRKGLLFLSLAVAGVGFTMAVQMGVNANFVADQMKLTGQEQGLLEASRETCGIIALGVLAAMAGLAEPLVGAAMLLLVAAGMAGYCFAPDFFWLVAASVVWSQGLHVWMPLPPSMALGLAEPGRAGRRLGQMYAAGAAGTGLGILAAWVLNRAGVPIRPMFLLAGAAAVLAAVACLGIPRRIKTPGPRLVLRRKYWLYYLLTFLEGWRKQIFLAFAGFLLVKEYHTPLGTMLLLFGVIQVLNWVSAPHVGRLIDRIGERKVLVFYFTCLIGVFAAYALLRDVRWLYGLYIADSALFVLAMGMVTYVNRIAPPQERTATLSMGVAFNHVASVTMPLVGGLLWKHVGYQWVFLIGVAAAAISAAVSLLVPKHRTSHDPDGKPNLE